MIISLEYLARHIDDASVNLYVFHGLEGVDLIWC